MNVGNVYGFNGKCGKYTLEFFSNHSKRKRQFKFVAISFHEINAPLFLEDPCKVLNVIRQVRNLRLNIPILIFNRRFELVIGNLNGLGSNHNLM